MATWHLITQETESSGPGARPACLWCPPADVGPDTVPQGAVSTPAAIHPLSCSETGEVFSRSHWYSQPHLKRLLRKRDSLRHYPVSRIFLPNLATLQDPWV